MIAQTFWLSHDKLMSNIARGVLCETPPFVLLCLVITVVPCHTIHVGEHTHLVEESVFTTKPTNHDSINARISPRYQCGGSSVGGSIAAPALPRASGVATAACLAESKILQVQQ